MPPSTSHRVESTPFRSVEIGARPAGSAWPRSSVAWAVGTLTLDLWMSGGVMLWRWFVCISVLYTVPRVAQLLYSRRGIELRMLGRRAAIWCVAAMISFGVTMMNESTGAEGERAIIAAVHRYRDERGRYPDTLEELVPHYLRAVPRARRLPGMFARFEYSRYGDDAHLRWTVDPPFGRWFYTFNARRHRYLD